MRPQQDGNKYKILPKVASIYINMGWIVNEEQLERQVIRSKWSLEGRKLNKDNWREGETG